MTLALYRKHRPTLLSEVIGQERVTATLLQALKQGQVGHAYIFSGPRGTGKTSVARILARAVNCAENQAGKKTLGEPCNKCDACTRALKGQELDLVEIDAASNRGIDEIRELREKVRFAPGKTAKKVFLIDEFHMLTKEAFNALLKTLEEPPEHAIFILATTEIHNVPATILSRAQHYRFKALAQSDLVNLVNRVAKLEKIEIDPAATALLAQQAEGGGRDVLGLIELMRSAAAGHKITEELVYKNLALPNITQIIEWISALASNDQEKALSVLQNIEASGQDLKHFTKGLIGFLRIIMLHGVSTELGEQTSKALSNEQKEKAIEFSRNIPKGLVIRAVSILNQAANTIKASQLGILPLEIATLEIIKTIDSVAPTATVASEPTAEKKTLNPKVLPKVKQSDSGVSSNKINSDNLEPVDPKMHETLIERWSEAVAHIRSKNVSLASLLNNAVILEIKPGLAVIVVEYEFYRERLMQRENRHMVEQKIEDLLSYKVSIECRLVSELDATQKAAFEGLKKRAPTRQKPADSPVGGKEDKPLAQLAVDLLGGQVVD